MLPIRLNLLPPPKRERLARVVRFLFLRELLEYLVFTSAVVGMVQLVGWLILTSVMQDLIQSSLLINRDSPKANQEIRQTNLLLKELAAAGAAYAPLTPRLTELAESLPPDIKLTALKLNRVDGSLLLAGTALSRAALLNYQQELRRYSWISQISVPTSQLFQKENIPFELRATLKGLPPLFASPVAGRKTMAED